MEKKQVGINTKHDSGHVKHISYLQMEWPTEVQVTFFKPHVQDYIFQTTCARTKFCTNKTIAKQLQAEGIIATSASITKLLSPD